MEGAQQPEFAVGERVKKRDRQEFGVIVEVLNQNGEWKAKVDWEGGAEKGRKRFKPCTVRNLVKAPQTADTRWTMHGSIRLNGAQRQVLSTSKYEAFTFTEEGTHGEDFLLQRGLSVTQIGCGLNKFRIVNSSYLRPTRDRYCQVRVHECCNAVCRFVYLT